LIRDDVTLEVSHKPHTCHHWGDDDDDETGGSHESRWWTVTANGHTLLSMSECCLKWMGILRSHPRRSPFTDSITPLVTGHPDWDPTPPPVFNSVVSRET
jgi:hypothetical protein